MTTKTPPEQPKRRGRPPLRGISRQESFTFRLSEPELEALRWHGERSPEGSAGPMVLSILAKAGVLAMPKRKGRTS